MIEKMPKSMYSVLRFLTSLILIKCVRKTLSEKLKKCRYPYPWCSEYKKCAIKIKGFEKSKHIIKNLIIGSSHGDYGYVPSKREYNLCVPSQDLYYSSKLYEKYAKDMHSLQNVILFYSVFSSGFCLPKTSEKFYCLPYYRIGNIEPQTKEAFDYVLEENQKYTKCLELLDKEIKMPKNYMGQNLDKKGHGGGHFGVSDVRERAKKHLKNNQRGDLELIFLQNLIKKTTENNHQLFIVLSPAHRDYKGNLPDGELLFASLKKMLSSYPNKLRQKIDLIDLYTDFDLPDDCWFDYDHLNKKGAKLVTTKIKEVIA